MSNPIIPLATIREAAFEAARAGNSQCPPAFQFVESVWRREYKLAQHELHCQATA